jgi:uncharacterized protein with von Willebrand factor type A (vWA) domain
MDERIVEFIAALRGQGLRVSVAESADALRALEHLNIGQKDTFRAALQATLVKDQQDVPVFQKLFPQYFGTDAPPMMQPGGGGDDSQLSEQERQMLQQMLEQMLANMTPEQLRELLRSMMTGQPMSREQLRAMLGQLSQPQMTNSYYQRAMAQRALRELEFDRLNELLQELLERLREAGMSEEALQEIEEAARQNQEALAQAIARQVGQQMAERQREERQRRRSEAELMERPFEHLGYEDIETMRGMIARLAAQIRSRAALRQRRGKTGTLDAKTTIRVNMRYSGVPVDVRHRKRHLKPKLALICDLSISMRPVVSFMLMLVYAMQDQISRTRSFAFINDLHDISMDFNEHRPAEAIEGVLQRIRPPGNYSTDLGNSLNTFVRDHMGCVDRRTTVIILGDGRNNYNDPGMKHIDALKRRARKLIWFNPEGRRQWGTGDSDMHTYAPACDAVHVVGNLQQLAAAVDMLFARR